MQRGIACAAGSYKGVFVHGVLDSFEGAGLKADMYGAASSSTVCAAFAAAGCIRELGGVAYWKRAWELYTECRYDISAAVLRGIEELLPSVSGAPFVDASYTCFCPAVELAELGCREVIAISPEAGVLYRDFFHSRSCPRLTRMCRSGSCIHRRIFPRSASTT
jgi:hypothetical protein